MVRYMDTGFSSHIWNRGETENLHVIFLEKIK